MREKQDFDSDQEQGAGRASAAGRVLVVAGMHRSGTSLLTSVLQRSGLDVGGRLLGPNRGNPYGHFEDLDFFDFHEASLRRSKASVLLQSFSALQPHTAEEEKHALKLIRARETLPLWGWKDPRTCLFLDFWSKLLPRASYVLVYRHPIHVVLSLLRRAIDTEVLADPLAALRAWCVYNRLILDHYRRHRNQCVLCNIDSVVEDFGGALDLINKKLGLELNPCGSEALFHPADFRRIELPQRITEILRLIDPETTELYEQLGSEADLSRRGFTEAADLLPSELAVLEDLVLRASRSEALKEVWPRPLFSLLLGLIDPNAVSHLALAVPKLQDDREALTELRVHLRNLEELSRQDRVRVREVSAHAGNLEALLEARQQEVAGLRAHTTNLEKEREVDEDRVRELVSHAENLESLRSAAVAKVDDLEAKVERQAAIVQGLETEVSNQERLRETLQESVLDLEKLATLQESRLSQQAEEKESLESKARRLEEQEQSNQELIRELEAQEQSNQKLIRQLEAQEQSNQELIQEIEVQKSNLTVKSAEQASLIDELKAEVGHEEQLRQAAEASLRQYQADSAGQARRLSQQHQQLDEARAAAAELTLQKAKLEKQQAEAERELTSSKAQAARVELLHREVAAQLEDSDRKLGETTERLRESEARLRDLVAAKAAQDEQAEASSARLTDLQRILAEKGKQIERLEVSLRDSEARESDLSQQVIDQGTEIEELRLESAAQREALDQQKLRLERVGGELERVHASLGARLLRRLHLLGS